MDTKRIHKFINGFNFLSSVSSRSDSSFLHISSASYLHWDKKFIVRPSTCDDCYFLQRMHQPGHSLFSCTFSNKLSQLKKKTSDPLYVTWRLNMSANILVLLIGTSRGNFDAPPLAQKCFLLHSIHPTPCQH